MPKSAQSSAKAALGKPFAKGTSGNPGGRPKVPDDVKEAFRAKTMRAVERLAELLESKDAYIAIKAIDIWLERALGKVAQPVEHDGNVTITVISPYAEPPK